jgi:hypothetical protein
VYANAPSTFKQTILATQAKALMPSPMYDDIERRFGKVTEDILQKNLEKNNLTPDAFQSGYKTTVSTEGESGALVPKGKAVIIDGKAYDTLGHRVKPGDVVAASGDRQFVKPAGDEFGVPYEAGLSRRYQWEETQRKAAEDFSNSAGYVGRMGLSGVRGFGAGIIDLAATKLGSDIEKRGETYTGIEVPQINYDPEAGILQNAANIFAEAFNGALGMISAQMPGKRARENAKRLALNHLITDENAQKLGLKDATELKNYLVSKISDLNSGYYAGSDKLQAERQDYGAATQFAGDIAEGIGRMAPAIAAGVISKNPNIALTGMGASAAGSKAKEAADFQKSTGREASYSEALKAGVLQGSLEVATEKMFGGIIGLGKGAVSVIAPKAAQKLLSPRMRKLIDDFLKTGAGKAARYIGNAGGEGAEEIAAELLGSYIDRATFDPNAERANAAELLQAGTLGAAISMILGVPVAFSSNTARRTSDEGAAQEETGETQAPAGESQAESEQSTIQAAGMQPTVQPQQETQATPARPAAASDQVVRDNQAVRAVAVELFGVEQNPELARAVSDATSELISKADADPEYINSEAAEGIFKGLEETLGSDMAPTVNSFRKVIREYYQTRARAVQPDTGTNAPETPVAPAHTISADTSVRPLFESVSTEQSDMINPSDWVSTATENGAVDITESDGALYVRVRPNGGYQVGARIPNYRSVTPAQILSVPMINDNEGVKKALSRFFEKQGTPAANTADAASGSGVATSGTQTNNVTTNTMTPEQKAKARDDIKKSVGHVFKSAVQGTRFDSETKEKLSNLTENIVDGNISLEDATNELYNIAVTMFVPQAIQDEEASAAKSLLRTPILIDDDLRTNIPDFDTFRKKNINIVRLAKTGVPMDIRYQELSEEFPWLFPEDITHPTDQLETAVNAVRRIRDLAKTTMIGDLMGQEEIYETFVYPAIAVINAHAENGGGNGVSNHTDRMGQRTRSKGGLAFGGSQTEALKPVGRRQTEVQATPGNLRNGDRGEFERNISSVRGERTSSAGGESAGVSVGKSATHGESIPMPAPATTPKKPGLVRDAMFRSAKLPHKQARILGALADMSGTRIRFADNSEFVNANGKTIPGNAFYSNGEIVINVDSQLPVTVAVMHELVHEIREKSSEDYITLKNSVRLAMDEEQWQQVFGKRADLYKRAGISYADNTDALTEEVVADGVAFILGDSALMERFAAENRTLFQKIMDMLRDMLDRIRKISETRTLSDAEKEEFGSLSEDIEEIYAGMKAALENVGRANSAASAASSADMRYSAMYRNPAGSTEDFFEFVKQNRNNPLEQNKSYFTYTTPKGQKIELFFDGVVHIQENHNLTATELEFLLNGLDNIDSYAVNTDAVPTYGGSVTKVVVDTPNGKGGLLLEVLTNGRITVRTAFFDISARLDDWLQKNKKQNRSGALANGSTEAAVFTGNGFTLDDIIAQASGAVNTEKKNLSAPADAFTSTLTSKTTGGTRMSLSEDANEVNRRFNEELDRYANTSEAHVYNLGMPSGILRKTGFPERPIEMSNRVLTVKREKHRLAGDDLKDLVLALQEPVAVFGYGDRTKAQNVIVDLSRGNNNLLAGIHFGRGETKINDIRTLYHKDSHEWLNWIAQGKLLYADINKIQALTDQQRTTLAEVDYLDLESINNLLRENAGVKHYFSPELKQSVLYEGQPRFSLNDPETAERARRILDMEPLRVTPGETMKQTKVETMAQAFGLMRNENDGRVSRLPVKSVGKIIGHQGYDISTIFKHIPKLYKTSLPAWSEGEAIRENHKNHPNIKAYHNYVNSFDDGNEEYFIRFTVSETKANPPKTGENLIHSTAISEVEIYMRNKKGDSHDVSEIIGSGMTGGSPYKGAAPRNVSEDAFVKRPNPGGVEGKSRFVDTRLQQFFDSVKREDEKKPDGEKRFSLKETSEKVKASAEDFYPYDGGVSEEFKKDVNMKAPVKSEQEIVGGLLRGFGITSGKKLSGNVRAVGRYYRGLNLIRLKDATAMRTAAHEVGHWLDERYGLREKFGDELLAMANKMPVEVKKLYSADKLPGEALADFVNAYVTNPDRAKELAEGTKFFKKFEGAVSKNDIAKLKKSRKEALRYQLGNAVEQLESQSKRAGTSLFNSSRPKVTGAAHFDSRFLKDVNGLIPKFTETLEYTRTYAVDMYTPLRNMAIKINKKLKEKGRAVMFGRNDLDTLTKLSYNSANKAYNIIFGDFVSSVEGEMLLTPEGKPLPSFKHVLDPLRDRMGNLNPNVLHSFSTYLKALDSLDRLLIGKKVFSESTELYEILAAIAAYGEMFPLFKDVAAAVYRWQDAIMLEYAVRTGMDGGLYPVWRKLYPHHIPEFRIKEKGKSGSSGSGMRPDEPFMRTAKEGGTGMTYDAIDCLILQTQNIVNAANNRALWGRVHDMFQDEDARDVMKDYIVPVESTKTPHFFNAVQTKRNLESALFDFVTAKIEEESPERASEFKGMSVKDKIEWLAKEGYADVVDSVIGDLIKFYTVDKISRDSDVVSLPVGDDYVHYQIVNPAFGLMVEGMTPKEYGTFYAILAAAKRAMTALTTGLNLTFSVFSNAPRDFFTAYIQGEWFSPVTYVAELIKAMGSIIGNTEMRKLAKAGGAGFDSLMGAERARTYASIQRGLGVSPRNIGEAVSRSVGSVGDILEAINNFVESVPRQAAFNYSYRKSGKKHPGISEGDRLTIAQNAYADITVNFKQHGAGLALFRGIVPFLNSYIQAMDKMGRTLTGEGKAKAWAKLLGSMGILSIILAVINHDDEDYEILTPYEKNSYWHVYKIPGTSRFIRIRKPQEYGILGSAFEQAVVSYYEGEWGKNFKEWAHESRQILTPPVAPAVVGPVVMTAANMPWYDPFTGEIVNMQKYGDYIDTMNLDEVYDENTSYAARALAEATPDVIPGVLTTPMGYDYLLKQTTGFLGQWILPAMRPGDYDVMQIFFGRAYVDATKSNRLLGDIYDMRSEYNVKAVGIKAKRETDPKYKYTDEDKKDYRTYEFLGRVTRSGGYKGETKSTGSSGGINLNAARINLGGGSKTTTAEKVIPKGLGDYSKEIKSVETATDLSPEQKRKKIDELLTERNRLARTARLIAEYGNPTSEHFKNKDDLAYARKLYTFAYLTAKQTPDDDTKKKDENAGGMINLNAKRITL